MNLLVVDNDCDSRALYAAVFEGYGAEVTAVSSVNLALKLFDPLTFDILICELRFAGERIEPLIQQVREMTLTGGRATPILATSTCSPAELTQNLAIQVDAYLLKPIAIDCLVAEVWNLVFWSRVAGVA